MNAPPKVEGYVVVPIDIFVNAETIDEVEDWLMCQDEEFMARLVEARRAHLAGDFLTLEEVKAKLRLRRSV